MYSKTSFRLLANLDCVGTLKPQSLAFCKPSNWVFNGQLFPITKYNKQSKGRLATSALSCNFKLPEAVFLGFE